MQLKDFLKLMNMTGKDFAEVAGISKYTIYRYLSGEDIMLTTAIKIEKTTLGRVTCHDLAEGVKSTKNKDLENQEKPDETD